MYSNSNSNSNSNRNGGDSSSRYGSYSRYGSSSSSSYSNPSSNSFYNRNNNRGRIRNQNNSSNSSSSSSNSNSNSNNNDPNLLYEQSLLSPSSNHHDNDNDENNNNNNNNNDDDNGSSTFRRRANAKINSTFSKYSKRTNQSNYMSDDVSTSSTCTSSASTSTRSRSRAALVPSSLISSSTSTSSSTIRIAIVVMFWYILGVLSITTTKIILRDYSKNSEHTNTNSNSNTNSNTNTFIQITPLGITLQQLILGSLFLYLWTYLERNYNNNRHHYYSNKIRRKKKKRQTTIWNILYNSTTSFLQHLQQRQQLQQQLKLELPKTKTTYYLIATSTFFTLGFLFTNYSFSTSDPTFVETIKASEPMTSATLAYMYRIESLTIGEIISLVGICFGVLISTLGHNTTSGSGGGGSGGGSGSGNISSHDHHHETNHHIIGVEGGSSIMTSIMSSGIVMCSNLCFSFRGLYQKLYRSSVSSSSSSTTTTTASLSDYELQLKIHQIGIIILLIPFCILECSSYLMPLSNKSIYIDNENNFNVNDNVNTNDNTNGNAGGEFMYYVVLSFVNAFAFTHYNLASSYVLTRISVVHHAALNCIRRLFAIIMTSIIFGVPITLVSGIGIFVSIGGFIAFTYYKLDRKKKNMNENSCDNDSTTSIKMKTMSMPMSMSTSGKIMNSSRILPL